MQGPETHVEPPADKQRSAPTIAVHFQREGYDTGRATLMGRQSAGEGFLAALAQYSTAPVLGCFAPKQDDFDAFNRQVEASAPTRRVTSWIPTIEPEGLRPLGCLYRPGPTLAPYAWRRRVIADSAYSLCGITHTIASAGAMEAIGDMLVGPVHEWDALICTSEAVKASALSIADDYAAYLGERFGTKPKLRAQLPVIPLGVDAARFASRPAIRAAWRTELGLDDETIAFLYLGRLSFHAKAHPLPMFLALERAARESGKKVALIQAGWFGTPGQERVFKDGVKRYSPSVNCIFLDGRKPDVRAEIWQAGDVFITLSDNVQESFGLTPIEAMAAGLPVIASDWDGYRQTLAHGRTGLMVPTAMGEESTGVEMAVRFIDEIDDYDHYVGGASQTIAVDVEAATAACRTLIDDPALRAKMGENGRRDAADIFDWRHVIAQYEDLWSELGQRREAAAASGAGPGRLPPLQGSPMRIFANYASRIVDDDAALAIAVADPAERLRELAANVMNTSADYLLMPMQRREGLLKVIASEPSTSMRELIARLQPKTPDRLRRTLMWMLKCGLIKLV